MWVESGLQKRRLSKLISSILPYASGLTHISGASAFGDDDAESGTSRVGFVIFKLHPEL